LSGSLLPVLAKGLGEGSERVKKGRGLESWMTECPLRESEPGGKKVSDGLRNGQGGIKKNPRHGPSAKSQRGGIGEGFQK